MEMEIEGEENKELLIKRKVEFLEILKKKDTCLIVASYKKSGDEKGIVSDTVLMSTGEEKEVLLMFLEVHKVLTKYRKKLLSKYKEIIKSSLECDDNINCKKCSYNNDCPLYVESNDKT